MFTDTVFAIRVMKAFASCGHFPRAFISQQITQRLCAAFLLPIISTSCYLVGCLWPIAVILFLMGTNTSLSSVATESIFLRVWPLLFGAEALTGGGQDPDTSFCFLDFLLTL